MNILQRISGTRRMSHVQIVEILLELGALLGLTYLLFYVGLKIDVRGLRRSGRN